MNIRTLSTAVVAACSLAFSVAVPASASPLMGASPGAGTASAVSTGVSPRDGFVRSLGAASTLVPRATGYDAVDPAQGYGTITGRVTVPSGMSLDYASVTLADASGNPLDGAYVGSDGQFGITSLDAGTYTLTAVGESTTGQGLSGGPVQASVTLGMLTSGVVLPLDGAGPSVLAGIEGTITGPAGALAGWHVGRHRCLRRFR